MLLRPATPLALVFLVAFVLLLLTVLSDPIIHAISLGTYQGWNFGVFGYCKGSDCVGPKIGYSTDGLFSGDSSGDFTVDSGTRHAISAILIVHPVAAFLVLVCFGLACAAHFHGPSHSPRYLLALLILTIPTLLVTLLAFLVDILLFVPHMAWGGWIVLAATVLIMSSTIITCAMRRTLVSRKARKKRIAENADMSGGATGYYDDIAAPRSLVVEDSTLPRADSPPPMNGSLAADKAGPQFATFEMKTRDTISQDGRSMDDRVPLNPKRDPSVRSASTGGGPRRPYDGEDMPPMPNGRPSMDSGRPRRPSHDRYGNPIPGDLPPPGLRHKGSQGSLGSNRSGGRGRGGYGPGPRGYGPQRGGYGAPRGGYGPRGGFRGAPPPPGWNGRGRGYGPGPARGGMVRQGPPPEYGNVPSYGAAPMRAEFVAGPIGQAIEMDERTGTSSPPQAMYSPVDAPHAGYPDAPHAGYAEPPHAGYADADAPHVGYPGPPHAGYSEDNYGLRDSDGDVAGMVGLQQGRQHIPGVLQIRQSDRASSEAARSPTSIYSGREQSYVPPRNNWGRDSPSHQVGALPGAFPRQPSDDIYTSSNNTTSSRVLSPIAASPQSPQNVQPTAAARHLRQGSDAYYEDVDPRFAEPHTVSPIEASPSHPHMALPAALTPGGPSPGTAVGGYQPALRAPLPPPQGIPTIALDPSEERLDAIPDGARSPGELSEASHYTSISQRPINPDWRPDSSDAPAYHHHQQQQQKQQRNDVILNTNPDFSLPGVGFGGRGGRGGRGRGRSGLAGPPQTMGLTPSGRYPTEF